MADEKLKAALKIKLNRERIRVNPQTRTIDFGRLDLNTRRARKAFIEIKEEFGITDDRTITDLITRVTAQPFVRYHKKEASMIIPTDLKLYDQIKIFHVHDQRENFEELLKIDKNEFLLINHTRGTLRPGDILSAKSSPWSLDSKASFKVSRDGNEVRQNQLYQLGIIKKNSTAYSFRHSKIIQPLKTCYFFRND